MSDAFVQILPDSTGKEVKAFQLLDINGNTVYVQAIAIVDESGDQINPLSEQTGQQILNALNKIGNLLAISHNQIF